MHEYPVPKWERVPGGEKGYTAEEYMFPVRISLGRWKISRGLSHFVECYHSGAGYMLPFAVNVGVSPRFAVFVYKTFERKEKNEKNC